MSVQKRVLITGASKGIGRATMLRLTAEGYRVTGLARTRPADAGPAEEFHAIDLTDLDATRALIEKLAAEQPFYALVNNAATAPVTSLEETTPQTMRDTFELNLNAVLVCTQAVLPGMRTLGAGRIVNLSSRAALGKANRSAYSASKAAIMGLSRTWALELAAHGITVNVIAPGPIATEMFQKSSPPNHPATIALMSAVPVRRIGTPEEIAHAMAYLLDPRCGFMTGQTLHIDGGLTIGAAH
jgi:NAD(P)-dependent dehydrogenase (short-subunit alcohol dehydrogenase family)